MTSPDYDNSVELEYYDFSAALDELKKWEKIAREWWNWKRMWLRIYQPYLDKEFTITENYPEWLDSWTLMSWIWIHTMDNTFVPWTPNQTDLLTDDWIIVY